MKYIPLSQGKFAIVDDDDYDALVKYKWHCSQGYAYKSKDVKHKSAQSMHRMVNRTPPGYFTDHINGNPLDNRKSNLRTSTLAQNRMNQTHPNKKKSGIRYKGVTLDANGKYRAKIGANRKRIHLGVFDTIEEAAMAYNDAAILYHGEFACLNQINEKEAVYHAEK